MRLTERQPRLAHQPVGEVGRGGEAAFGEATHPIGAEGRAFNHAGHRRDRQAEQVVRLEYRRFVVLHVLRIGERQALHRHHQRGLAAEDAPGVAADQLGGVGIALLRHDRAAGRPLVAQSDEAERLRRPQHELFRQAAEVQRRLRRAGQVIEREVAVAHPVQAVARRPVEAERCRRHLPIQREAGAGERGGAERAEVHPRAGIAEARDVARRHLDIGHQVMAQRHRLRGLQMGEARHHRIGMLLGAGQQRVRQAGQRGQHLVDRIAHPQAEIGRDLIVAAARGVQAAGNGADRSRQLRLGQHMDVFEGEIFGHAVRGIVRGDRVQPRVNRGGILDRHDALFRQHRDMRLRSGDILTPHPLVEGDRGVNLAHYRSRAFGKSAAPHRIGTAHVRTRRDRLSPGADGRRLR